MSDSILFLCIGLTSLVFFLSSPCSSYLKLLSNCGILDFFSNSGWLTAVYGRNHPFLSRTVPLGILDHLLTGRMYGQPPTYGRKSDGRTRNTYGAQPYLLGTGRKLDLSIEARYGQFRSCTDHGRLFRREWKLIAIILSLYFVAHFT